MKLRFRFHDSRSYQEGGLLWPKRTVGTVGFRRAVRKCEQSLQAQTCPATLCGLSFACGTGGSGQALRRCQVGRSGSTGRSGDVCACRLNTCRKSYIREQYFATRPCLSGALLAEEGAREYYVCCKLLSELFVTVHGSSRSGLAWSFCRSPRGRSPSSGAVCTLCC